MKVRVIMENDHPRAVVHCQDDEDMMRVEQYCDKLSTVDDQKTEYWWSREFELKAPEDLV